MLSPKRLLTTVILGGNLQMISVNGSMDNDFIRVFTLSSSSAGEVNMSGVC